MELAPNHVCKYSKCKLGENGTQKHYYACPDCDNYYFYRSMGCCFEHYALYQNEIAVSRGKEIPFPEFEESNNKTAITTDYITSDKVLEITESESYDCDDIKESLRYISTQKNKSKRK